MARDKICGIYKITNIINGKCYIGQSVDIYRRLAEHKSSTYRKDYADKTLYKAISKYGIENFIFEIIEECDIESLNDRENYWMSECNSIKNGYNQVKAGLNKFVLVTNPKKNETYVINGLYTIKNDNKIIFKDIYDIADENFENMTETELDTIQDGYETMFNDFCDGYRDFESWAECNLI